MNRKFKISRITLLLMCLCLVFLFSCGEENEKNEVRVETEIVPTSECETIFSQGINVSSEGERATISFSTNKDWSVSLAETQNGDNWCTVSPSSGKAGNVTLTIVVASNTGYDDRNVVLKLSVDELTKSIMINQKQKDALTLTSNRFEVDKDGGIINLQVKSNIDYNVTVAENSRTWIEPVISERTRGLSTSFYSFAISPSEEYDKREGEIIITSGESDETVKVYQTGSAILILSQNEYTFGCDGGRASIDISSNFEYEIDMPNVDWIQSANLSRAVSSHTLVYEISANNTYADREAVIVFKDANGNKKESVSIKQNQKDAILLSNNKVEVPQNGGTFFVDVNSNVEYSIEIPPSCNSWISRANSSVNVHRGLSKTTSAFSVASSDEYDKREGEIYFKYNDISDTLKVYQSGGAILVLTQSSYNIDGNTTSINVQLKSNIDYGVSISNDWITEIPTRSISNSMKKFNIMSNTTGKSRTGKITFTSSDGKKTETVTVIQATVVKVTALDILFNGTLYAYVGDSYNFFVTCKPSDAVTDYEWSSSDIRVLTVSGSGGNATVKIVGYGEANVVVKDKNSGVSKEYTVHSRISDFSWSNTGGTYSIYPMLTLAVGESQKISYTSKQGSSVLNIFGNLSDFVFYEPVNVVSEPSVISIDADGTATGLKTGIVGIKPTGYITRLSSGNERVYVNVIPEYIESEYNNNFSNANTIKDGQSMKFSLSSTRDVDVFKFNRKSTYMHINLEYLGSFNDVNYSKRLRYEVYDSNYKLTGSGTLSLTGTGQIYDPMLRYVGSGDVAYVQFYFSGDYIQNFPDGYFKVSIAAQ